ncbi:hypothetical protein D3C80_1876850 [compost metagenome]
MLRWDASKKRNEALDCFVYALAALRISQDKFGLDLESLTDDLSPEARGWPAPEDEPDEDDDEPDAQGEPDQSDDEDEPDEAPAEPEAEPNDTTLPEPMDADGFLGVGDNPWL